MRRRLILYLVIVPSSIVVLVILGLLLLQAWALVYPMRYPILNTPDVIDAPNWRSITFESSDGLQLSGWYIPPTREDGASVLFVHGIAGSKQGLLHVAEFIIEAGYGALLFDLRNHGESEGRVSTFSNLEQLDVQAAHAFLIAQPEVNPDAIAIFGQSMGGATAIRAMANLPGVKALIVDTAYTSSVDVFRDGIERLGIPPLFFHHVILGSASLLSGSNYYAARPIDVVDEIQRPILFISGTNDATIPYQHLEALYTKASHPKDILLVPDAGHVMAAVVDPTAYSQRILEFLVQHVTAN